MYFKELEHEYFIHDKQYTSWSSIIKCVEPEKDWNAIIHKSISNKKSKYYNRTFEDVRAEWDEKAKQSREKGTAFHALKEAEDIASQDSPVYFSVTKDNIKPIRNLEELEDGIYPELALYNNEYQACGTADKVIIETINGIRYVDVEDYKTNETIEWESFYNFKNGYSMLEAPLQNVMDCSGMKYSLQLSMYAFFLEKYNFVPRKLTLIHLVIKEGENEDAKYKIEYGDKMFHVEQEVKYPVKYMKKEVKALLQHFKIKNK